MFQFLSMLNNVNGLGLRTEYPINTQYKQDTTPLDVFMALFMFCTIEIVVLKIMVLDDNASTEEPHSSLSQN